MSNLKPSSTTNNTKPSANFRSLRFWGVWLGSVIAANGLVWLLFQLLPASAWRESFLGNECATLVGVLIGIPVALEIDRRIRASEEATRSAAAQEAARQRKVQFLNMLYLSLRTNLIFLESINEKLKPKTYITGGSFDLQLLEATASVKYEIIDNLRLCGVIDAARYFLIQLSRSLDLQLSAAFSDRERTLGTTSFQREQEQLIENVHSLIPTTREHINEALTNINAELIACGEPKPSDVKSNSAGADPKRQEKANQPDSKSGSANSA